MHSDFVPLGVQTLFRWMQHDLPNGELFGIDNSLFFIPKLDDPFRMERYGKLLETPLGVAAGPHTQLAQNIITAWICGARYIELKTVQVLDELNVAKPCIDMMDEGYNCEWSQELKLEQSFEEYLKAFVLIHVLRNRLGLPTEAAPGKGPGFIFNMSAGYNLEGIQSPTVQRFLDRMENCTADVARLKQELAPLYPDIDTIDIPGRLSDNLTVSTMHGCPPEEIERIGRYFIEGRGYHTTIKLNPTLLGADRLRFILNDTLGYPVRVPDEAFEHDLKYSQGVELIRNLRGAAEATGVAFSLKLTNTLETVNEHQNLPASERMVYMSGRALHPISINLAERLQQEFDGTLDISFSAGIDAFNAAETLACGLRPLTLCSDILKPGGYGRLHQTLENVRHALHEAQANSLDGLASHGSPLASNPGFANLISRAASLLGRHTPYRKDRFPYVSVKTERPLPRFDCAAAPCMSGCPTGQHIPRYLEATARGDFALAWRIITATNPLPNVQGMVCSHPCQSRCTRINYDSPLLIREIKRFIAHRMADVPRTAPAPSCGKKVAIIGAGPSGLSCASFLAARGVEVHLHEGKDRIGGMTADAIPAFRLDDASLQRDLDAVLAQGVRLHTESPVDKARFAALRDEMDAVYIAVGAQKSVPLGIPGETTPGVLDQLSFLSAVRRNEAPALGTRVIVIGGGNSALDCARTARRLLPQEGDVSIIYRRTRKEMPADIEEIVSALKEGVRLVELCAPEEILVREGRTCGLRCARMRLEPDPQGGRPVPVRIDGEGLTLEADTLIISIGQRVQADFLEMPGNDLRVDPHTCRTPLPGVFAGGDATRGASTLINAIGDGRRAAQSILHHLGLPPLDDAPEDDRRLDPLALRRKQAVRLFGPELPEQHNPLDFSPVIRTLNQDEAISEARRCLQCDLVCNVCVTVCPNRANLALHSRHLPRPVQTARRTADGICIETVTNGQLHQPWQVVNIADACNECGNCASFCPSGGAPYRDKPRLHLSSASFAAASDGYRLVGDRIEGKRAGKTFALSPEQNDFLFVSDAFTANIDGETLCARKVTLTGDLDEVSLSIAVEATILYRLLKGFPRLFPTD